MNRMERQKIVISGPPVCRILLLIRGRQGFPPPDPLLQLLISNLFIADFSQLCGFVLFRGEFWSTKFIKNGFSKKAWTCDAMSLFQALFQWVSLRSVLCLLSCALATTQNLLFRLFRSENTLLYDRNHICNGSNIFSITIY